MECFRCKTSSGERTINLFKSTQIGPDDLTIHDDQPSDSLGSLNPPKRFAPLFRGQQNQDCSCDHP